MDAETLGHCCRRLAKWQVMRLNNYWKSEISAVRSCALVLNELCDKTRGGKQQKNMNCAAPMQQNF
jgi:hypothetical protein